MIHHIRKLFSDGGVKMVNFGERLHSLRTQSGMTQTELAKRLGITKSVVSYYERLERSPSPDVLIQLADIFRVTTDYLLGITHKKTIDVTELDEEDMKYLLYTVEFLKSRKERQ